MEDKTVITTAPPPPSGVRIRTMRSDLESMRKSGGGMPTFQNVNVRGLSLEKEHSAAIHPISETHEMSPPVKIPAAIPAVESASLSAPTPPPAPSPMAAAPSADSASQSNLVPILIVTLVAILAIAGVGYFAYITFFK